MHCDKIQQEALATPGRTEDERMPDILDVQRQVVGRVMPGFEDGKRLAIARSVTTNDIVLFGGLKR